MPRFFIEEDLKEGRYQMAGEDARHMSRSLRMKPGEEVILATPTGFDVRTIIVDSAKDQVTVEVIERKENATEPHVCFRLYQCCPKGNKMEQIIKQAVEMGVSEIIPVISRYCVSRPRQEDDSAKKRERYQKIALEAAMQSGRGKIPEVKQHRSLEKAILEAKNSGNFTAFFYESATDSLKNSDISPRETAVNLFIGSEGGFAKEEVEMAKNQGFSILTLGSRILRTETAPIAALAVLSYYFGEM